MLSQTQTAFKAATARFLACVVGRLSQFWTFVFDFFCTLAILFDVGLR